MNAPHPTRIKPPGPDPETGVNPADLLRGEDDGLNLWGSGP